MAVIYLRHAIHGTKVACSEEEAKADEKVGWERFQVGVLLTPQTQAETRPAVNLPHMGESVAAVPIPNADREVIIAQYVEKFGRKPHHKKSVTTLQAELAT